MGKSMEKGEREERKRRTFLGKEEGL